MGFASITPGSARTCLQFECACSLRYVTITGITIVSGALDIRPVSKGGYLPYL